VQNFEDPTSPEYQEFLQSIEDEGFSYDNDSMVIGPLLGVSHVWYTRQTMTLPIVLYVKGQKVETIALVDSGAAGIFIN